MTVGTKIGIGFGLALAILVAVGASAYWSNNRFAQSTEWQQQTYKVLRQLEELHSLLADAQRGERGFLLTGDEKFLRPYHEAVRSVPGALEEARELTRDIPTHQKRMASLSGLVKEELEELEPIIGLYEQE